MFADHFYNERVRKSVAIFGSLFDNIYVVRKSGNTVVSQMKVPLSYSPKRKFLERISQMADGEDAERQLAIKLPRMSFEVTNIQYDANRQLPKMNYYSRTGEVETDKSSKYRVGVPYIISFELSVYAKQQDDALQVVEQILPYFSPQYTISVKPYSGVDSVYEDVPIILNSVAFSDDYEGAMEQRRTIVYTLSFDMKVNFYGPKPRESGVIREINVNFYDMDNPPADSDFYLETLQLRVNPFNASKDSDYTVIVDILDSAQ
jgi:hypothetical protein